MYGTSDSGIDMNSTAILFLLGVQPVTVIRCGRSSWYLLHIIGLSTFNQFAAITLAKRRHLYCTQFVHIRLNKM